MLLAESIFIHNTAHLTPPSPPFSGHSSSAGPQLVSSVRKPVASIGEGASWDGSMDPLQSSKRSLAAKKKKSQVCTPTATCKRMVVVYGLLHVTVPEY